MATFEKGVDSFGTLLTDAQDGGKKAISAKDKQRVAVIKMYTLARTLRRVGVQRRSGDLQYQRFHSQLPEPGLRRSRWQDRASNGSIAVRIAEISS